MSKNACAEILNQGAARIANEVNERERPLKPGELNKILQDSRKLSAREQKELAERIKAMTPEELAIVVENIPVEMCMARINSALARAAEFERSVKEACGMK